MAEWLDLRNERSIGEELSGEMGEVGEAVSSWGICMLDGEAGHMGVMGESRSSWEECSSGML